MSTLDSCYLKSDRPCDSKNRKPNRYSRKELEILAKKCNITNYTKKTMDELCSELKNKTSDNKKTKIDDKSKPLNESIKNVNKSKSIKDAQTLHQSLQKIKKKKTSKPLNESLKNVNKSKSIKDTQTLHQSLQKINKKKTSKSLNESLKNVNKSKSIKDTQTLHQSLQKIKKKKTLKPLVNKENDTPKVDKNPKKITKTNSKKVDDNNIIKKPCTTKSKNAFRPNYICKNGRWTKMHDYDYLFKHELDNMEDNKLIAYATKIGIDNGKEVFELHGKTYFINQILNKQYPLVKDTNTKNKYIQKFKKYISKKINEKDYSIKHANKSFRYKNFPTARIGTYVNFSYLDNKSFSSMYKINDKYFTGSYLLNDLPKNDIYTDLLGLEQNMSWIDKQVKYQQSLPFVDQLCLLVYTYAGDRFIHSYLDDNFSIKSTFDKDNYNSYIYPLYPALIYYMQKISSKGYNAQKMFMTRLKPEHRSMYTPKSLKELLFSCLDISKTNYNDILNQVFRAQIMTDDFYKHLVLVLKKHLNHIIMNSPKLTNKLVVYKGLQTFDFLDFSQNNMYVNKRFISTSFNLASATHASFVDLYKQCCLQKITLLKDTSCLFIYFSVHLLMALRLS
jgi:hypothetical protein